MAEKYFRHPAILSKRHQRLSNHRNEKKMKWHRNQKHQLAMKVFMALRLQRKSEKKKSAEGKKKKIGIESSRK